jgi:ATP-dependent DNA helicase RecG
MLDHELENLLLDLESDRVERKASAKDVEKIRQAICAFANDLPDHRAPGVVFVGVNDDGSPSGLEITDQLLLNLAAIRDDGLILPLPSMVVQKRTLRGTEVAVVLVQPADAPPVRYRSVVWIRVGPRRATASAQEERQLTEKRRAGDPHADAQPVPGAALDDVDLDRFRNEYLPQAVAPEVLEQNQRSVQDQLASLRFVTPPPAFRPTRLGLLVAGRDPQHFLAGAYVQFLRLDGTELTDPIKDSKQLGGTVLDQLRRLDEVFLAHVSTASLIGVEPTEVRQADYPRVAFQEIVRNAVMHRVYEGTNAPIRVYWYSDRIEVLSPGGPYGNVSRATFGQPGQTDYRNPNLAEAMRLLGFVQKFGVGLPLARKALERNGNPPLELVAEDTHVLAILRRRP